MNDRFRPLENDELDEAFEIHNETVNWLLDKGIRQWTQSPPRKVFRQRQEQGELYGLEVDERLVAIISILSQDAEHWQQELGDGEFVFLAGLCTGNRFRGNGFGKKLLEKSIQFLETEIRADGIYLDCVFGNGFLPRFYRTVGFLDVARKDVEYSTGVFDMLLMRRPTGRDLK